MTRNLRLAILTGIIILGFTLRLYQIDAVAFRGDEAYTVQNWVLQDISSTLSSGTVTQDPQAPLSYIVFWLWGKTSGVSEFSLRILPALLNITGIAGTYALGKRFVNRTTGLVLALMWALHPFQIWHSQDARNYAIWAGFSIIAIWLALRALAKQNIRDWILYGLFALMTAYIYYLELFVIGALSLYVLIAFRENWRVIRSWILTQTGIGLCLLPWYLYLWTQLQSGIGYGGTTGGFNPGALFTWFVPTLTFGSTMPSMIMIGQVTSLILIVLLFIIGRDSWEKALFLSLIMIMPMIGLAIVSTRLNVFTPRYIMASIPAYLLTLAYLVSRKPRIIGWGLIAFWVAIAGISNYRYFAILPPKAPDWRILADYLETSTESDDIIIQTGVDAGFGYYYNNASISAEEFALPSNFDQPIPDVIAEMERTVETFDTIWIVGQTFSDWQNTGVVEAWAFDNLQLIRDTRIAGLPVRQFMTWQVQPSEIEDEPLAIFGDAIALMGMDSLQSDYTQDLLLRLYWEANQQTDVSLTVFTHLVGGINPASGTPLWSQDDHPPQNGRATTDLWQLDTVYRDTYTMPLDSVPPGAYRIHIGFYNPLNGERLLLADGSDAYIVDITIE